MTDDRDLPEMPEPPEVPDLLPLLIESGDARLVAGLRLIVVWLGVGAFVVPVGLVALGARWLPCVLLVVGFVIAAACVSVHADTVERS